MWDYASSEAYSAAVLAEPKHVWTRDEQLAFAMANGKRLGPPGVQFAYSDTGYILLASILERKTGLNWGASLRRELDATGVRLPSTWLERLEPESPAVTWVPQYYGGLSLRSEVDPSMDLWGGGGLVSNTADLTTYFEALGQRRLFKKQTTLATMLTIPPTNVVAGIAGAGMGVFVASCDGNGCRSKDPTTSAEDASLYHDGAWGVRAMTCPRLGLSFAAVGLEGTALGTGLEELTAATMNAVETCGP